ncbi:MAG TPA: hypothetical protein VF174_12750 [Micromonosporaceae bacterium]
MNTRQRARARANNEKMADFIELWIIGVPEQVAALVHLAMRSGRLVYASPPTTVGNGDPRMRRYLRLRNH